MLYPNGSTTEPRVSDNFGPRTPFQTSNGARTSSYHYGVDYVGIGTVRAIADGIVRGAGVISGWGGAGIQVLIEHDGFWSRSFHLSSASVSVGQRVSQGQAIGIEGSTGNVTGKHLHLQIHVGGNQNGNAIPPRDFIAARLGGGGGALTDTQRRVSGESANRRIGSASTSAPKGEPLAPGETGNFVGFVRGQVVDGNGIWFVGTSGNFFWSGGFEGGANTAGLKDITPSAPAPLAAHQRQVGGVSANRRIGAASTSAPTGEALAAGEVGDFKGYVRGQVVDGNGVWFVGQYSGDYFWSGSFTSTSIAGLADLTPAANSSTQRTVKSDGTGALNVRAAANTSSAIVGSLPEGSVQNIVGWTTGENALGSTVWFKIANGWIAAGGTTNVSTDGLTKLDAPTTPPIETVLSRTPVYPKAVRGWSVPLGQGDRDAGSVIDRFIIHHTTNTGSDENYFKTKNDRSSAPTWYVMADGSVVEIIDPTKRPSATGSANTRSVAVETQNTSGAPAWGISEESHESIAQTIAWFHSTYHGKTIGGFPVDLPLDRAHIIGHNEAGVNATACPGPSMNLDRIVARAKEIAAGNVVTPPVTPTTPEPDGETVPVSKTWLQQLLDSLKKLLGQ